jgi:hypothetical protein
MDQFFPVLFDGTTRVEPPKSPEQRYHLSDDITEKAIAWIREQQTDGRKEHRRFSAPYLC